MLTKELQGSIQPNADGEYDIEANLFFMPLSTVRMPVH